MKTEYSLLELAIIPQGTAPTELFQQTLKVAQRAEKWGYKRFWLAEHHNSLAIASSATQVLIGYIANGTKTIKVGSGGVMLPNHSPLIVAEQFGTLGLLYPDRIDLGLGRAPGTDQLTASAIRSDRMTSVYNFPTEIEQIQTYFSTENSKSKVRVPFAEGVEVPIYILGSSTDSAHLAAAKGLPYAFASHFASPHLFEALKIYHNNFQPSQFLKEPYTIAAANVLVADTNEEADRLLTSLIMMFYNVLTGQSDFLQPPTEMTNELRELWAHPSIQQMLKYTFVGDKEKVKTETIQFIEATKVNEVMAVSNMFDVKDRLRSLQYFSEIMQELNG